MLLKFSLIITLKKYQNYTKNVEINSRGGIPPCLIFQNYSFINFFVNVLLWETIFNTYTPDEILEISIFEVLLM